MKIIIRIMALINIILLIPALPYLISMIITDRLLKKYFPEIDDEINDNFSKKVLHLVVLHKEE